MKASDEKLTSMAYDHVQKLKVLSPVPVLIPVVLLILINGGDVQGKCPYTDRSDVKFLDGCICTYFVLLATYCTNSTTVQGRQNWPDRPGSCWTNAESLPAKNNVVPHYRYTNPWICIKYKTYLR